MKIINNKKNLKNLINQQKSLGFVPTMGGIHKGHLSLIKKCNKFNKKTLVSIFVNAPQFNNKNDYVNYPRSIKADINKIKKLNVDYLYLPVLKEIYPKGPNKKIKISSFAKKLCGKFRPGHFHSVVDVIERFIKIIKPSSIYLGEKDMQQLKIVEDFIKKNYKNIKVIGCKTVREKNGIALSSRNILLSRKEKNISSKVFKIIKKNKKNILEKSVNLSDIKNRILKIGVKKIDYINLIDVNRINKPFVNIKKNKIFIAYYLGNTRLIDNI